MLDGAGIAARPHTFNVVVYEIDEVMFGFLLFGCCFDVAALVILLLCISGAVFLVFAFEEILNRF